MVQLLLMSPYSISIFNTTLQQKVIASWVLAQRSIEHGERFHMTVSYSYGRLEDISNLFMKWVTSGYRNLTSET